MQKNEVIVYAVTDAAIAKMEDLYLSLKVSGLDDEEGFSAVHDGRMVVKGKRIEVEKKRKEYKASSLAWGRKVDGEAKRIFGLLKPIEDHLQAQENIITKEKERIKALEEAKEKIKIETRVSELFALGVNIPFFDLAMLSENEYAEKFQSAKIAYDAEQLRLVEEEKKKEEERLELECLRKKEETDRKLESERLEKLAKDQAIEAERLAKIQDDIDAKAKILKDEQDKLEADKKAEQARKDLEILEMRLAAEAKAKAEKESKEKAVREAMELKEKEAAAAVEKIRQEALAPDKTKLLIYAQAILDIPLPSVRDNISQAICLNAKNRLKEIADKIIEQTEEM